MVFSIYISDDYDEVNDNSYFTVGGYDLDRFAKDQTLTWNALTETDYWRVDLEKAVIGDVKVLTSTDSAIIDSGTTYIALPDYDRNSLISLLDTVYNIKCFDGGYDLYTCTCPETLGEDADLPKALKITLSGTNSYEVPFSSIVQKNRGSDRCELAVQSLGSANFWILGDSFMRQYYSIFDLENG